MKFTANLLVTSPPGRFSGDVRSRRLLLDGGLNFPPSSAQGPRKGPLFSATRLGGRRRIWANYLGGYAASREQAMRYFKARYIGPSN
jgi:hypothetical protein